MRSLFFGFLAILTLASGAARADFQSVHYSCHAAGGRTIDYWFTDTGPVALIGGKLVRDSNQVTVLGSRAGRFVVISPNATKSLSILLPSVQLEGDKRVWFRVQMTETINNTAKTGVRQTQNSYCAVCSAHLDEPKE